MKSFFRRPRTRSARIALWIAAGLAALYVVYVAGAAVFLNAGGMEWATKNEKDVHVLVGGGHSFFPGFVHVEDLRIRFKDYNIEMEIAADEADAFLALWKLPFMKIHVSWIRAQGAEYRMVHRVHDREANAARLAAFPDIPGFDRPLYYDAPPPPPSDGKLWKVQFDSIDADVRLAWVLEYQLRGNLKARGSFFLDPNEVATIHPCSVDVRDATISIGKQRIARDVHGVLGTSIDSFYPPHSPIDDVAPKITANIEKFHAYFETLSFLHLYLPADPIRIEGEGALDADAKMTRGRIDAGSKVSVDLKPLTLHASESRVTGHALVGLTGAPDGRFETRVEAEFPEAKESAIAAEKLAAMVGFAHDNLTNVEMRSASVDARNVRFTRPDFFRDAFGKSTAYPVSGAFDAQAEIDLPREGEGKVDAKLATRSMNFYTSGIQFGMTSDGTLKCHGTGATSLCALDFHAPYVLFDKQPDPDGKALWLRVRTTEDARVSRNDGTLTADLEILGSDPKAVASELIGDDWLVQLGLGLVPMGPLAGTMHIERDEKRLRVVVPHLKSGSSKLQGRFDAHDSFRGAWMVDMPTSRWGFELKGDGVAVHPLVGSDWLSRL